MRFNNREVTPTPDAFIIQTFSLGHSYDRQRWLFRGVNLQIRTNDFAFITGPSGSGKSTFLKLLIRETRPTLGQILVLGHNLNQVPENRLYRIRRNIGFVFQDFRLIPHYTVLENIAMLLRMQGMSSKDIHREAIKTLQWVGLSGRWREFPPSLSGGEQQRVALARAIIHQPKLLLADEPTGNLDPEISLEIMRIFLRINTMGTTVIIATHDDRLIQILGGRVFAIQHEQIQEIEQRPLNSALLGY